MRLLLVFAAFSGLWGTASAAGAAAPITAIAWAPDGQYLVTASQDGIALRAGADLRVVRVIDASLDNVHDLAFSPGGDVLLAAGGQPAEAGVVLQFAWPSGERVARLEPHEDIVYDVDWSPDGQQWASAGADGLTLVWKPGTDQPALRLAGHSQAVTSAVFLDAETLVTASTDQTLRVWSLPSGIQQRTLTQHTAAVLALAVRPTRSTTGVLELASVARDRTVRLWQPTLGRMVRFARLEHGALCVAWTPDGRSLVVGCEDGHVRSIDPQSVKVMSDQPLLDGWLHALAVNAQGDVIAGGEGGQLHRAEAIPLLRAVRP